MNEYVLRGGEQGASRLRLLAQVQWPYTRRLLLRAGLREGLRCIDLGCGIGAVALQMARQVGPNGRVVGIDIDGECLAIARQEAQQHGLNVEFRQGTLADVSEVGAYDLVFARFLLTHLPDPEAAVRQMLQAACPGGVLAVEDIDFAGHFSFPKCPAFDCYVELYREVVRRKGGDAQIGPRLLGLLLDAGLEDVRLRVVL